MLRTFILHVNSKTHSITHFFKHQLLTYKYHTPTNTLYTTYNRFHSRMLRLHTKNDTNFTKVSGILAKLTYPE